MMTTFAHIYKKYPRHRYPGVGGWAVDRQGVGPEMKYFEISTGMSSLYFGLADFAYLWPEFQNLTRNLFPPPCCGLYNVHCTLYTERSIKFWDSSFELA
jgi:hypothetical protein